MGHNGPDKLPTIAEARACLWGVLASRGETDVTKGTQREREGGRERERERERERVGGFIGEAVAA